MRIKCVIHAKKKSENIGQFVNVQKNMLTFFHCSIKLFFEVSMQLKSEAMNQKEIKERFF